MNASWTVAVERLEIGLRVGVHADELEPQTVWVSLRATGEAHAVPKRLDDCLDYEPLCRWLAHDWPKTPHTPLLEARINQLFEFVFGLDERVQTVWVGLYKQRMSRGAMAVGMERQATRLDFEAVQDLASTVVAAAKADPAAAPAPAHERTSHADIHWR